MYILERPKYFLIFRFGVIETIFVAAILFKWQGIGANIFIELISFINLLFKDSLFDYKFIFFLARNNRLINLKERVLFLFGK